MELREVIRVLRRNGVVITAIVVTSVVVSIGLSLILPKTFESEAKVLFTPAVEPASPAEFAQSSTFIVQQVQTYAELVDTPLVLQSVVDDLALDITPEELAEEVDATPSGETPILTITARADTAAGAVDIVESTTASLADVLDETSPGQAAVSVSDIQEPLLAGSPSSPDLPLNLLTGLALGLLVSLAVVVLRETLNTRLRNVDDVTKFAGRDVLGVVPQIRDIKKKIAARRHERSGVLIDAFRQIRPTLISVLPTGSTPVLVVSAADRGEGTSTAAVQVAMTFAEIGRRVVLIDANLRHPSISRTFSIGEAVRLDDYLLGRAPEPTLTSVSSTPGLEVIVASRVDADPSSLLGSAAMQTLLEHAKNRSDLVVLDSGPLLSVGDATALAPFATAYLVITRSGRTRAVRVKRALDAVTRSGAEVSGVVLNGVPTRGADATA